MSGNDILRVITEGAVYDLFKHLIAPAIITAMATFIAQRFLKKMSGAKDIFYFSTATFVALCTLFFFIGSTEPSPQLAGAVQSAITASTNNRDTEVILTLSISNAGTMPSVIRNWHVMANVGGATLEAGFPVIPDNLTVNLPDLGPTAPKSLIYHAQDDIIRKSDTPIQVGGAMSGTMVVVFSNVPPDSFKSGAEIVVNYADVRGKTYTASIRMTPKLSIVTALPTLHTETVCPAVPGLPSTPNVTPFVPKPSGG